LIFRAVGIPGAFFVEVERIEDERGFFARTFCRAEFGRMGLVPRLAQCSVSFNRRRGTLRGMHWQAAPHEEARLVRCTRGGIYDVLLDMRRESQAFGNWIAAEVTAENRRGIYVPEGVAHGFQTLTDDTEVLYQMSEFYEPSCARGVRWDDPAFGIKWPVEHPILSERDRSHALWA
jgi:dTDP-4-dehydrorhamnose 3,5-epimerase